MTSFGIAYGLIGVATIAACAYMVCHGCAWWQGYADAMRKAVRVINHDFERAGDE